MYSPSSSSHPHPHHGPYPLDESHRHHHALLSPPSIGYKALGRSQDHVLYEHRLKLILVLRNCGSCGSSGLVCVIAERWGYCCIGVRCILIHDPMECLASDTPIIVSLEGSVRAESRCKRK
ncbi:hypothetical protein Tco_0686410 [Tanacetum coccineum]